MNGAFTKPSRGPLYFYIILTLFLAAASAWFFSRGSWGFGVLWVAAAIFQAWLTRLWLVRVYRVRVQAYETFKAADAVFRRLDAEREQRDERGLS